MVEKSVVRRSGDKSARRRARELALQGLYQWQLAQSPVAQIIAELAQSDRYPRADADYFQALIQGVIEQAATLEAALQPHLDRSYGGLTPIERAVLLIGGFEMLQRLEIPAPVIINEAVELAKSFGGTDGHKFVHGVLDKMARQIRPSEHARHTNRPRP